MGIGHNSDDSSQCRLWAFAWRCFEPVVREGWVLALAVGWGSGGGTPPPPPQAGLFSGGPRILGVGGRADHGYRDKQTSTEA